MRVRGVEVVVGRARELSLDLLLVDYDGFDQFHPQTWLGFGADVSLVVSKVLQDNGEADWRKEALLELLAPPGSTTSANFMVGLT
jgi:hypothetical protein